MKIQPTKHTAMASGLLIAILSMNKNLQAQPIERQDIIDTLSLDSGKSTIPYAPDLAVGLGIESASGQARGECVKFEKKTSEGGMKEIFYMRQIETKQELARELNITAQATIGFGPLSVSPKAQYINNRKMNSFSIYLLIKHILQAPVTMYQGATLSTAYLPLLKQKDGKKMLRGACGDRFISGQISGGEYYAIMQISASSIEEFAKLQAEAKVGIRLFQSSAEFSESVKSLTSNKNVEIVVYTSGGANREISVTPEGLIKDAASFSSRFFKNDEYLNNGEIFSLITRDYASLPPPDGIILNPIDVSNQDRILERFTNYINNYDRQIDDIDYILQKQEQFISPNIPQLKEAKSYIIAMKSKAIIGAKNCFANLEKCIDDASLEYAKINWPQRRVSCKNPIYALKENHPLCGVKKYVSRRDAVCGVQEYQTKAGPICGVKLYAWARSPACGVESYNEGTSMKCPGSTSSEDCPGRPYSIDSEESQLIPLAMIRCITRTNPGRCRLPEFGVQAYSLCRHPSHAVEEYETCTDPSFGVKQYKECERDGFGVKEWESCRNPSFGLERCGD